MRNGIHTIILFALLVTIGLYSCVKDKNFDPPKSNCTSDLIANATYAQVKGLYVEETIQIQEDLVIEGYVISSDAEGNFFGTLYFQDSPNNPTAGFQMEVDVRDTHLFYPVGSKILIRLKGLYLGKSKDVFKIGGVFTSFGNLSVGRLPAAVVADHILVACDERAVIAPTLVTMDNLHTTMTNTLVQLANTEILASELNEPFALEGEETERTLTDCNDNELVLLNSGFSDFQAEPLPQGSGTITGVLSREGEDYFLIVRSLEDIDFSNERCEDFVDEFTATTIFISELADPDNNSGARFVELYNSSPEELSLNGWELRRYTNANTEVGATIDLSDFTISGRHTLVLSPNGMEFENTYGFAPDVAVGTNSPADSNGDDNLVLVDPFGTIIDIFGRIGEDGSGTDHEFEDGRAIRKATITQGNATYTFGEWEIYNDTGGSGTIDQPQNAPEDFTPGIHD